MQSDPYNKMNIGFLDRLVKFFIGWVIVCGAMAQSITETNWYFGNSTENLVFDLNGRDTNLENNQSAGLGAGGSSVITDQLTGNVLFYSDGQQVFDAGNNTISAALNGDPTLNVPVVIAPISGSPRQYYFFTNSGAAIEYSTVDATLTGNGSASFPLGEITGTNTTTGLTNPSEGMIIIPSGDGVTFWLITQNSSTFIYSVTELDGNGIGSPVNYDFTGNAPGAEAAHFSFNQDSSYLAVAPKTANRNVRLLDFDESSGVLAFNREILNTGYDDGQNESVYDVEWSSNGSKLYLSRFGSAATDGNIYQYDLGDILAIINPILNNSIFRSYGLQRGLDGRIYHLHQLVNGDDFALGRINEPDSISSIVDYIPQVFNVDFNGTQFPNFSAGYAFAFTELDFTYLDSCQDNLTKFFPIVDPVPQQFHWDFTGGSVSDDLAPIINFSNPGNYNVTLTAIIGGVAQSVSKNVGIIPSTAMVDLGNDTTICVDETLILDAGTGSSSYLWSTGALTQTIAVDTAGTYWVEILGPEGCPAYDEIKVTEYGLLRTVNNQWYFGENAGIDFTNGATPITDENLMFSPEGCASVSDLKGDLLFYTNGSTVWNKDHQVMMNGDSIGGDSTAIQSAFIMPFIEETTMYYIFLSEEVYGTGTYKNKVAIVDMKRDSARGQVMVKNIALNNAGTEKMISTSTTGAGWVLMHDFGSNMYRSNLISDLGISQTVFSPVGEVHDDSDEDQGGGVLKFSNGNQFVGAGLPRSTGSFVELLDFDQTTGALSNPRLIDIQEADPIYGLEFSQGVTKLYVSTDTKLLQYDLDSIRADDAAADIQATKFDGYTTGSGYGSLQMGPDGIIYMAVDNSLIIGSIASANGDDLGAGFDLAGFDLLTRRSRLGLPNFGQIETTTTQEAAIVITPGCFGQPSLFSGVGRDNSIEEFSWIFGDGSFATGQDTTHVYALPGIYTVQMLLFNRCDGDTVIYQDITISPFPEEPQVPLDTTICDVPITLSAWPVDRDGYTYNWSTGETTREIIIDGQAIITVSIISPDGCESETVFSFVRDGRPPVEIGDAAVHCIGDSPPDLVADNPGASYEWQVDANSAGNSMTQSIDTSAPGIFEYTVAVIDPLTMCIGRDTLQVTILNVPDVTIVSTPTMGCGNDDGQLDISFNTAGNFDYEITGPTSEPLANIDGINAVNFMNRAPGNYTVTVANTVTGCEFSEIVQVTDPGTISLSLTGNCDGEVELTLGNPPAGFTVVLQHEDGTNVTTIADQTVFSNLNTGTYFIEVTDAPPNCVQTAHITVPADQDPRFTFDAAQSICGITGDIFVVDISGATYVWNGPSFGPTAGESVTVTQAGTYQVTASQAGRCDLTENIEVSFNANHSVIAEMTGDPCDGEIMLNAAITGGTGPYSYLWNSGEQTESFSAMISGSYSVTVRDQTTGCSVTSPSVDVTVEELLEVSISATSDCNNNGQIILDAVSDNSNVSYSWTGPGGTLSSSSPQITISTKGEYTVTITSANGVCSVSEDFDGIITPITDEDLLLDNTANFCSLDTENPGVDLNPGVFNTYEWTLVPDATIISTDRILNVTQSGTYEVTLYNGFTCTTDRITVNDDCKPVIFAPTAFTPNEDGLNDAFAVIPNPNVIDFTIVIANRWGELVFTADDQNFTWDGTLERKKLPPGTYTYRMIFNSTVDSAAGQQDQFGAVLLVR